MDLRGTNGAVNVEWFNPSTGTAMTGAAVNGGASAASRRLSPVTPCSICFKPRRRPRLPHQLDRDRYPHGDGNWHTHTHGNCNTPQQPLLASSTTELSIAPISLGKRWLQHRNCVASKAVLQRAMLLKL